MSAAVLLPPASARRMLTPADLDANPWVTCGQTALAALVGLPLAEVRPVVPRRARPWMNFQDMARALDKLGFRWRAPAAPSYHATQDDPSPANAPPPGSVAKTWPRCGLVIIQWRGPWEAPERVLGDSLKRSHWIAVAPAGHRVGDRWLSKPALFDVNGIDEGAPGGWMERHVWAEVIAPDLAKHHRGATGAWWVRAGIEVELRT